MIQRTIEDHPDARVSPHVHWCLVRRGEITIGTSDHDVYQGDTKTEVRMPPVARSWQEFREIVSAAGADATAALC